MPRVSGKKKKVNTAASRQRARFTRHGREYGNLVRNSRVTSSKIVG